MMTNYKTLSPLVDKLKEASSLEQKLKILRENSKLPKKLYKEDLSLPLQIILESLFAIGQGERIFAGIHSFDAIIPFLKSLIPIEEFYAKMGGIVGYHCQFLKLLSEKDQPPPLDQKKYLRPPGLDITSSSPKVKALIRAGIETLSEVAEIYPIGGAADRLDLRHKESREALPACALNFLGCSLLEGLIRDVIAKEYLHFKLFQKQVTIPLVVMSSNEKGNLSHVLKIFKDHHWYQRPEDSFFFLHQPLVPMIQSNGEWVVKAPLSILLKPGGHGVLWKLLQDQGSMQWLKKHGREKALIRQINNPIAGTDYGLLVLSGMGCKENRVFGFSSCERHLKSSEGMDVLIEESTSSGYRYTITNVEYTEFEKKGIADAPENEHSLFSAFPANTNLLFVHLTKMEKVINEHPYPGLLINLKTKGESNHPMGRLELTMQNIADFLTTESAVPLDESEKRNLPTFVTYNVRQKTLASTKKSYEEGKDLRETPEGVLIEVLRNARELLKECAFELPSLKSSEDYLKIGPSFLFSYHPALGPLYQVIKQKLKKGLLHEGAELRLEIADVVIENLDLNGSLIVVANQVTGHLEKGITHYSLHTGKCILKNVTIENEGIDRTSSVYWSYDIVRKESLTIQIEGDGEFVAENVQFKGNYTILVPKSKKMTAFQKGDTVEFKLEPIQGSSWKWEYDFNSNDEIVLTFKEGVSTIP